MADVNTLKVVVLSVTMDPTVSTEAIRESVDLLDAGDRNDGTVRTIGAAHAWKWLWPSVALLLMLVGRVDAAAQTANGALVGTILDTQGGVLPGVTLTVRGVQSGTLRVAVTAGDGRYRIAGLPPGPYDLRAELEGFGVVDVKNLVLTIGLELQQDLTLGLQGVQEVVTVQGETPVIETTKTEITTTVTQQQIESLPIEGRSAVTLALLAPGTGTDATRPRRPGANVGVGGISSAGTNYFGDGMNNNTLRAGDTREDIPQAAVREFRVIVSQAPAEFGGRVGGIVSVVTKSGGNVFSGEAFEFFRDKSLNRVDMFQQQQHDEDGTPINDFRRDQYGFSLGGPLVKDRLHFFGSFERKDSHEFFTVNTGRPEHYSSLEGTFRGGSLVNSYFARGDLQATPAQRWFLRYFNQDPIYYADGAGGTNAAFSATDATVPGFSYILGHTWVLSPRIVNEFTAMYAESFQDGLLNEWYTPSEYLGTGSPRYNFPSLSWGASPATHFRNVYQQFREALSINTSKHVLKFGGGVQIIPTYMINPGNPNGTWTFSTDQYFNPSDPSFSFDNLTGATQFSATMPAYSPENLSHTFEAYIQDQWMPRPNVTLNLGLRYDVQKKVWHEDYTQARYPRPLPYVDFASRGDNNNFAPRLGLAWDINDNGRSIVRGAYGVVYTNAQNSILDGETNVFQSNTITIRNPSYPDPYQGRDPLEFVSTAPLNITIGANDLVNAPAQTVSGGFSRDFGSGLALHLDGIYTQIDHLPTNVQINQPDPPGSGNVPLPEWGRIAQTQPIGKYWYKALLARFDKRLSSRWQSTVSYTLSKQDQQTSVTNHLDPSLDYGPADTDRRHNLAVSGSLLLPADVTLGAIWTVRTAKPFSALAGRDINNDGLNTDFVPGTTSNQGNRGLDLDLVNSWRALNRLEPISEDQIDQDRYNRFDLRGSKTFIFGGSRRLELIAQVFNLFGTDNLGGIGSSQVNNALSASFGRILTAQPRQQAELAVRVAW